MNLYEACPICGQYHNSSACDITIADSASMVIELSPNGVKLITLKEDAINEIKSQPYF